jgi:hypothetical protein
MRTHKRKNGNNWREKGLLWACLGVCTLAVTLGGCETAIFMPAKPGTGLFRVLRYEDDGTFVVWGTGGAQHTVRLYGVRFSESRSKELAEFRREYRTCKVRFLNGGVRPVDNRGRLVYEDGYSPVPWTASQSQNIVESDGITPKKDEDGNPLVIAQFASLPPTSVQYRLVLSDIAEPDPQISDPFVDWLRGAFGGGDADFWR